MSQPESVTSQSDAIPSQKPLVPPKGFINFLEEPKEGLILLEDDGSRAATPLDEPPYEMTTEDKELVNRYTSSLVPLLLGEVSGECILTQDFARSKQGEAIRDNIIEQLEVMLGADPGFLDIEILRDKPFNNKILKDDYCKGLGLNPGTVVRNGIYRFVRFETIKNYFLFLREFEFPVNVGAPNERWVRIISLEDDRPDLASIAQAAALATAPPDSSTEEEVVQNTASKQEAS